MIRANKKRTFIGLGLAALLLALALGLVGMGCANDSGEGERAAAFKKIAPEDIPTVGLDVCTNCHFGQTTQWLTGAHANLEAINHATHAPLALGLDSDGFPYYAYFTDETCATCHDPLGAGQRLTAAWTGNVPRPVVGCESCHGGGAQHYGVGPIAFPKPDHNRCGQCHNASFPAGHLTYHPNGDNIVEEYELSGHFNSINEHTLATALTATPEDVRAKCSRCHTDEGFRLYVASVPGTLGYDSIGAILDGQPATEDASPVECRTCHDPHTTDAGDFTRLKTSVLNGDTQSGEFNQCTACHQLNKTDGTVQTQAYHDPSVNPYGSEEEIISDTHAAVPGDVRLNTGTNPQALYFVRKGEENACTACHNPHLGSAEINRQYAESGHGEPLADPWVHYPWTNLINGASPNNRQSRADCQRCHTSTGMKNLADILRGDSVGDGDALYEPNVDNDFSYLLPGDTMANPDPTQSWIWVHNGQLTTIYCWGCHTDSKGGLRNPGPFNITTLEAAYRRMDNSAITFPDAAGSNVCVLCHTGRTSGGTIANAANTATDTWGSNVSFKNSHYLTAGGNIFGEIGYEYPGLDYTNVTNFKHDQIGLAGGQPELTGTYGPCVGCHMLNNPEIGVGENQVSHLFLPVTKDGETITALTTTTCAACHNGEHELTAGELQEEKEHYQAALEALAYILTLVNRGDGGTGYFWNSCNPYFFKTQAYADACDSTNGAVKNWCTAGDANCTVVATNTGKPNMGAAFNFNMLEHDPGGFAHNRYYVKRLIYDSIDWIDNNALDNSVYTTLNPLDPGTHPYKALAMEYILSDTNGRP